MKCLFVGGTNDGAWIELDTPCPQAVQLDERRITQFCLGLSDTKASVYSEVYEKQTIQSGEVVFTFYRWRGLSTVEAICRLFDEYRPKSQLTH